MATVNDDDSNKSINGVINGLFIAVVVVCSLSLFSAGCYAVYKSYSVPIVMGGK